MLLSMKQLTYALAPLGATTNDSHSVVDIRYVRLWDDETDIQNHPLFVISASSINRIKVFNNTLDYVFLVQEDVPISENILSIKNLHIVLIPKEHSLKKISNLANVIFFLQSNNSLQHYDELLSTISRPNNFVEVARKISELTNCPIALIAGTRQILSSCEHDIDKDNWSAFLSNKLIKLTQIPPQLMYENFYIEPLIFPVDNYKYEVIFPIISDDYARQITGMLYLLCSDPLVPTSFANILHFTAYTMSWFFTRYANKDNAIRLQNQQMTFMLTDLLHGIIPSETTFRQVLGNLSFKTERELILICIRISTSDENDKFMSTDGKDNFDLAKKVFMDFFEDSFSFTYSADIFILTTPIWLRSESNKKQNDFTAALKEMGCYAGISSSFYSIDKYFIHHFSRCLAAADIAINLKEERRWTDFRAVPLLCIFSNNYASISHFCDPALLELIEYDKIHESDHLYTLCCYWQLNRDIGRICDYLHIHKNTLYYRLRKISNILRQDINDYDNFIQLSLSISILEHIGSIPRYRIFDKKRRQQKWASLFDYDEDQT